MSRHDRRRARPLVGGWHRDGGHLERDVVIAYARTLVERGDDCAVMFDPKYQRYHCIRAFAVDHWLKHYQLVGRFEVTVKFVLDAGVPG